jgi:hypothetical protein
MPTIAARSRTDRNQPFHRRRCLQWRLSSVSNLHQLDGRDLASGDKWFLSRDLATENVFTLHEANAPSGGRVTEIDIGTFLGGGPRNPEHRALLHLIGTLFGPVLAPIIPNQTTRPSRARKALRKLVLAKLRENS